MQSLTQFLVAKTSHLHHNIKFSIPIYQPKGEFLEICKNQNESPDKVKVVVVLKCCYCAELSRIVTPAPSLTPPSIYDFALT